MNSKHVSVAVVALLAATARGRPRTTPPVNYNAGDEVTRIGSPTKAPWLRNRTPASPTPSPTPWIWMDLHRVAGAERCRGAGAESDLTPDPSTSGDGMSLHWIAE